MTRATQLAWLALSMTAVACGSNTELMLVVKAAPGLTFGPGEDIDQLHVQVQPSKDDPTNFYFGRFVELCSPEMAGQPDCRPQPYVDDNYPGMLTLPIRLLLIPGDNGIDTEVRVWVDALKQGYSQPRLANGMRFHFSHGHRLWLELPLFRQCLDNLTCEQQDKVCGKDRDCQDLVPTTAPTDDDLGNGSGDGPGGVDPGPDLTILDLTTPADLSHACGMQGQPCCDPPETPCGLALSCSNGFCIDPNAGNCGQLGQQCCSPGNTCLGAGVCSGSACVPPCGADGQVCCTTGTQCLTGQCFVNDPMAGINTCHNCGALSQQCCPGMACGANLNCASNQCVACGTAGLVPCTVTGCQAPLSVDANGKCNSCGGSAGAGCCFTSGSFKCNVLGTLTCSKNDPIYYAGMGVALCEGCGANGTACCKDPMEANPCQSGLGCNAQETCTPCGTDMGACCAGNSCSGTGLSCVGSLCEGCGGSGQQCCPSDMGCGCVGGTSPFIYTPPSRHGVRVKSPTPLPAGSQSLPNGTICL